MSSPTPPTDPPGTADAGAAVSAILASNGLAPALPPACEREARDWLARAGIDDPELTDLRALPFVTIDNVDSRDLDQALFIDIANPGSGYRVYYALADASYYVRPGSALFDEALRRGASYYVPGQSLPMLPRTLSEGLVSLNPGVERRALVFDMHLDERTEVIRSDVYRARIASRAKLSYPGVQTLLDQDAAGSSDHAPDPEYMGSLRRLREVGEGRIGLARARDVVEYHRRETRIHIDRANPAGFAIEVRERNDVERYNEQISLLCNMEGGRLLEQLARLSPDLQSVFRVHVPPMHERLRRLRRQLDRLAEAHRLDARWHWQPGQALADYVEGLPPAGPTTRIGRPSSARSC